MGLPLSPMSTIVGSLVLFVTGDLLGRLVGLFVTGALLGLPDGETVGLTVCFFEGLALGDLLRLSVTGGLEVSSAMDMLSSCSSAHS